MAKNQQKLNQTPSSKTVTNLNISQTNIFENLIDVDVGNNLLPNKLSSFKKSKDCENPKIELNTKDIAQDQDELEEIIINWK